MPRQKKSDRDLPACVYRKHGAIYLVRRGKWIRLGADLKTALAQYAKLIDRPTEGMPGLLARWFDDTDGDIAASTRQTYGFAMRKLAVIFKEFEPHQVTARDVLTMVHHHRKQPATANLLRNVLINALDFGFLEGVVERNVARDVRPLATKTRDRYVTNVEFRAIYANATPTMQAIMDLLYMTGQRISDVLAIHYADLGEEGITFQQQKTGHRMIVAWSPELRQVVEMAKGLHASVRGLTLLHTRRGTKFSKATIRTLWDRAREAAGIPDARMHDIRAKSATDANKAGQDSKALLGHASDSSHRRYLRSKEVPVAQPVKIKASK